MKQAHFSLQPLPFPDVNRGTRLFPDQLRALKLLITIWGRQKTSNLWSSFTEALTKSRHSLSLGCLPSQSPAAARGDSASPRLSHQSVAREVRRVFGLPGSRPKI